MKVRGLYRDRFRSETSRDDGKRYEILAGSLLVTPAPRPLHQRVVVRLYSALQRYFGGRSAGEVLSKTTADRDRGVKSEFDDRILSLASLWAESEAPRRD